MCVCVCVCVCVRGGWYVGAKVKGVKEKANLQGTVEDETIADGRLVGEDHRLREGS